MKIIDNYQDVAIPELITSVSRLYPIMDERGGHMLDPDVIIVPGILCPSCRRIATQINCDLNQWGTDSPSRSYPFYGSLWEVKSSAQRGCHLCTLIQEQWSDDDSSQSSDSRYVLECQPCLKSFFGKSIFDLTYDVLSSSLICKTGIHHKYKPIITSTWNEDSNPPTRLNLSNGSSNTYALAAQWLGRCLLEHDECRSAQSEAARMPTRLIDIGTDLSGSSLRIIHPNGRLPYLALSHCWGTSGFLKLTQTNYDSMLERFSIQTLPTLFQNALAVTRRLGYRYLWIDSLCIIQDSINDWKAEASRMQDVYRGSTCTLAAVTATDSDQSLFTKRHPLLSIPCTLESGDPSKGSLIVDVPSWTQRTALYERTWVLQERLLSPRVLEYSDIGLFGHCQVQNWSLPKQRGLVIFNNNTPRLLSSWRKLSNISAQNLTPHECRIYQDLWSNIVERYGCGDLTHESDRPFALSGVIALLQQRTSLRFIAGLCQDFLPRSLLWYRPAIHQSDKLDELSRPSWSCTFRKGWFPMSRLGTSDSDADKKEVITELDIASVSPKDLTIDAIGPYCSAVVGEPSVDGRYKLTVLPVSARSTGHSNKATKLWFYPDRHLPPSMDVMLLLVETLVARTRKRKIFHITGLVLMPARQSGWVRVGMFEGYVRDYPGIFADRKQFHLR